MLVFCCWMKAIWSGEGFLTISDTIKSQSYLKELSIYKLNYMKKSLLVIGFICVYVSVLSKDTLKVCSPSGKICVKIWMGKQLIYCI